MLMSDLLQNAIGLTDAVRRFYIQCLLYNVESKESAIFQRLAEQEIHQLRALKLAREELFASRKLYQTISEMPVQHLVETTREFVKFADVVQPDTPMEKLIDMAISIEYDLYYRRIANNVMSIIRKVLGNEESMAFAQYLAMEDEHRNTMTRLFELKKEYEQKAM